MSVSQPEIIEHKPAEADDEKNGEPFEVLQRGKHCKQVATALHSGGQQRNGKQQGQLGDAYEIERTEPFRGQRGERFLSRQQGRSR
jgi:hypothetical protein